jgi:hypothetical protein
MNPAALQAALSGDISNAIAASTPGGIERQEAQGQRDLVATRNQLEALGFRFGDDADDLFVNVTFPPGWKLSATSHSMHNDLLDDQGRKRAGIFYKAAFYDRKADIHFSPRFWVSSYEMGSTEDHCRCDVKDGDKVLFEAGECGRTEWAARDALEAKATAWLVSNYPEYRDPFAYW